MAWKLSRLMASFLVLALLVASLPVTYLPTLGRNLSRPAAHASSPSQLSRSLAGILGSISAWVFPSGVAGVRSESAYYPVDHLTSASPTINAPTNVMVTATTSAGVTLGWTAPQGSVDQYQIERSDGLSLPFEPIANISGTTTYIDPSVTNLRAYLYRVRAISGGIPSAPSNLVLATAISFEFDELENQKIRAKHFYDVRTAINAVRMVANLAPAGWTRGTLEGLQVKADDVLEMRSALNEALAALNITTPAYEDSSLTSDMFIKATHIEQLQARSSRGSSNSSGPLGADFSVARLDPLNETGGGGENPLSRNFNWNVAIANLPGRAGLDLSIPLSYNSLVWTKTGNLISFDDDVGFPAPGFRLGFPVIQPLYYNSEVGKYAYLLIGSDGSRTELRQVSSSAYFESVDSAHLLLDTSLTLPAPDNDKFILRTTDGTHLLYAWKGDAYQCTQIKDRNGNFLTIEYTEAGRIGTITDTLNRSITFNYDNGSLTSISQPWIVDGKTVTHIWATFGYENLTIQTNFTNLTPRLANGSILKVLTRVTLDDGSRFSFEYTSWGQVWKIKSYAPDNRLLNYRSYNLPLSNSLSHPDCPRFTERRDWAENFNRGGSAGASGLPTGAEQEVVTSFAVPVSDSWNMPDNSTASGVRAHVTAADGTSDKIYFIGSPGTSSGWRRRLPALVNTYDSGNTLRRQTMTTWTQDNTTVSYPVNPRVTETNVYDPSGNRRRTRVSYQTLSLPNSMSCKLPQDVYEYQADASTVMRRSHTEYNQETAYTTRRILGLQSEKTLYAVDPNTSGEMLMSKVTFHYDETGSILGNDAPVQHDNTGFSASFVTGRANLSSVKRYDVTNTALFVTTSSKYNTAGSIVSVKDAATHETTVNYTDAFAANGTALDAARPFSTLGYPTTVNDADGTSKKIRYHYDFGAPTWLQSPLPNVTDNQPGPRQKMEYDSMGRLQRVTNLVNNAYTRFIYGPNYVETWSTVNTIADEARLLEVFDGHGRLIGRASHHLGSVGGFSGQLTLFDGMGRAIKSSNPTETSVTINGTMINAYAWVATGDDDPNNGGNGWRYTQQTYDWKGRPLITTNTDLTTKSASYTGCGCAGGEVVTLTDEGTIDAGVAKRRQQKVYSDVLGRAWKTEVLNWENGSVYSTTVSVFNARHQVTHVRQYAGAAPPEASSTNANASCPTGTCQETVMTFDGHARLRSKHVPEQNAGMATVWAYNDDDTIQSVTDARGAGATYGYNKRHLVTSINYFAPTGITATSNVSFEYDAAGNTTLMTDGPGSQSYNYDQLSRMISETKSITGVGSYMIGYDYNLAGQLRSVTDPAGATVNYEFDSSGRLNSLTGSPFGGVTTYASGLQYRAWGGLKHMNYGNAKSMDAGYDARLQTTSFAVPGVMSKTYEYHADGRLRFSSNPANPRFDRSYGYDHAARITQAFSGAEARGEPATNDRPYKQTFGYDSFNHLTNRDSRIWSQFYSIANKYANNRREGWGYDAQGNLLGSDDAIYTYDAAGSITTVGTSDPDSTTTRSLNGKGQQVKTVESTHNDETDTTTTTTTYYIHATVLGDQVLTELNENGTKHRTFVYAGGQVLAVQEVNPFHGTQGVTWEHRDPSGAAYRTTITNGDIWDSAELDPTGADAGLRAPVIPPQEQDDGRNSLLPYPSFSNPSRPGVTYAVNGIPVSVDYFMVALQFAFTSSFDRLDSMAQGASRKLVGYRITTQQFILPFDSADSDDEENDIIRVSTDEHQVYVDTFTPIYDQVFSGGGLLKSQDPLLQDPIKAPPETVTEMLENIFRQRRQKEQNESAWRYLHACLAKSQIVRDASKEFVRKYNEAFRASLSPEHILVDFVGHLGFEAAYELVNYRAVRLSTGMLTRASLGTLIITALTMGVPSSYADELAKEYNEKTATVRNDCLRETANRFGLVPKDPLHWRRP